MARSRPTPSLAQGLVSLLVSVVGIATMPAWLPIFGQILQSALELAFGVTQ